MNGDIEASGNAGSDPGDLPGTMRPSDDVRAELVALLEGDQSRLGRTEAAESRNDRGSSTPSGKSK